MFPYVEDYFEDSGGLNKQTLDKSLKSVESYLPRLHLQKKKIMISKENVLLGISPRRFCFND